jgi:thiol-disulfide isomerase/thioredoxin
MSSIAIGPFALPVSLVTLAISLGLGWWACELVARRQALAVEPMVYVVLATGFIAARLAFVLEYRSAYAQAPLAIVDIRDGGWSPLIGFAAAAICVALLAARRTGYGKPLVAGWSVALCAWLAGTGLASALQGTPPGLPAISLAALDGTSVNIAGLQGRPVVLNLWASWCPPCRREMPVLQQAQQRRGDVQFVFVDQGEAATKVQAFLSANRLQLRNVLLDPDGQVAMQLDQRAFPATLFFDARGHLVATRVGELSPATLAERLDALLSHEPSHP